METVKPIDVITTCAPDDSTISRCMDSFEKYWPENYRMTVFYEDGMPISKRKRVSFRPLYSVGPGVGSVLNFYRQDVGRVKSFLKDITRWAPKILTIGHFGLQAAKKKERFIWMDADVVTHSPVPEAFIEQVLNPLDSPFVAGLHRERMNQTMVRPYTETGFLAFDTSLTNSHLWFSIYLNLLLSGAYVRLDAWTDATIFDLCCEILNVEMHDLAAEVEQPCPGDHVFVHSMLGDYMDHLKGQRKEMGRSPEHPRYKDER